MVSLGPRPSSRAEMLNVMNVGWAANAGAGRGCFVRVNVINNMVEDGDNDTKDGDKTLDNINGIGNWIIMTRVKLITHK